MQDKLNHHFLPKFYLKGFASQSDPSHIWEYHRGRAWVPGRTNRDKYNPVFIPLRKAGAAIGEYAFTRPDGTLDFNSYEDALEQLEKPANTVFDKIRNLKMIDSSEREIFAAYMATMTRRVPARKELVKNQFPLVLEDEWRRITDELENSILQVDPSDQDRIDALTARLATCRQIIDEYRRSGMPREMELKTIVESTMPRVQQAMLAMSWQFLVAAEDYRFVTSDNPVHTFRGGVGFSKPYSELTFPVSARVALLGSYRKVQEGYVNVKPQLLKEINRRVIANASVYVYSSSKERWILTVMSKKFHRFSLSYPAPELSGSLQV